MCARRLRTDASVSVLGPSAVPLPCGRSVSAVRRRLRVLHEGSDGGPEGPGGVPEPGGLPPRRSPPAPPFAGVPGRGQGGRVAEGQGQGRETEHGGSVARSRGDRGQGAELLLGRARGEPDPSGPGAAAPGLRGAIAEAGELCGLAQRLRLRQDAVLTVEDKGLDDGARSQAR